MKKLAILGTIAFLGLAGLLGLVSLLGEREVLLTLAAVSATAGLLAFATAVLLGQRQILERLQAMLEGDDALTERVGEAIRQEASGLLWSMDSRLLGMIEAEAIKAPDEES